MQWTTQDLCRSLHTRSPTTPTDSIIWHFCNRLVLDVKYLLTLSAFSGATLAATRANTRIETARHMVNLLRIARVWTHQPVTGKSTSNLLCGRSITVQCGPTNSFGGLFFLRLLSVWLFASRIQIVEVTTTDARERLTPAYYHLD